MTTIEELTTKVDALQQKTTELADEMIRDRIGMAERLTALEEQIRSLASRLAEIEERSFICN